jgi:hypothetical protein
VRALAARFTLCIAFAFAGAFVVVSTALWRGYATDPLRTEGFAALYLCVGTPLSLLLHSVASTTKDSSQADAIEP